jgi:hypothetical protein
MSSVLLADEPKGATHTLQRTEMEPASAIAFNKAFGLAFDSLDTLGARIDQSRKHPDPVGLANAAHELAIAEKVSGKKAALTSAALWNEAVVLAETRDRADELSALGSMAPDESVGKKLSSQATGAVKRESKRKSDSERHQRNPNQQDKSVTKGLRVINNSNEVVTIVVNGNLQGQMLPLEMRYYFIGDAPDQLTSVVARGNRGGVWAKDVAQNVVDSVFILDP